MKILRTAFAALLWPSVVWAQPYVPHPFDYAAGFVSLIATDSSSASAPIPGTDVSFAAATITNNGTTPVSCTPAIGDAIGVRTNILVQPNGGQVFLSVGTYGGVHGYDHIACINQNDSDTTSNEITVAGGAGWDPSNMPPPDIYNPFPDPFQ